MRYEIKITAVDLMLDQTQARELLVEIGCFEGVDGVTIHTGLAYDHSIENEGSNSEDLQTTICFYSEGNSESVVQLASEVLERVNMMYETQKNGLWFTLTDVDCIEQYG